MLSGSSFRLLENHGADRSPTFREDVISLLASSLLAERGLTEGMERARSEIMSWPGFAPTPLVELHGIASDVGVSDLWYKDEGKRFGLGSFKAIGGGYAVSQIVARRVMRKTGLADIVSRDLLSGKHSATASEITVTCATDGNHGRGVAWAAREFGCRAVVYMASMVSPFRERAMTSLGAEVVRSTGNHEDAAAECRIAAEKNGWYIVSETENASEPAIAADTLAGYSTLLGEITSQLPRRTIPTHLFIQAGVGGLAAAAALYAADYWPEQRPLLVVVEARNADCILRSLDAGKPVVVTGDLETIMAGLAAGEVSGYAWSILKTGADFAMAIPDDAAIATMRLLADAPFGDPTVVGGESGVAGLAAALLALRDESARERLGITESSRILTIGTEGATDPEVYERLAGRSPDDV
jgi:diaminopropionate ammonia-lyase